MKSFVSFQSICLSTIQTYAGWDSGRDGQQYTVEYSTVAAPGTFLSLATASRFDTTSFPLTNPVYDDDGIETGEFSAIIHSYHNLLNEVSVDICETVIAALEAVGEAGVIDSQEVEGGGVEIVDVDRISGDVVTEVVGFSMDVSAFDARPGHPDAEAAGMVVAAVVVGGEFALRIDGAAELASPDDERVFQ
jgi:hypothetical protein